VPVSRDEEFVKAAVVEVVAEAAHRTHMLLNLNDLKLAAMLLRHCAGACLVNHLMRAVPPALLLGDSYPVCGPSSLLRPLDNAVDQVLSSFCPAAELTPDVRAWISLPIRMHGAGIPIPSSLATAAFAGGASYFLSAAVGPKPCLPPVLGELFDDFWETVASDSLDPDHLALHPTLSIFKAIQAVFAHTSTLSQSAASLHALPSLLESLPTSFDRMADSNPKGAQHACAQVARLLVLHRLIHHPAQPRSPAEEVALASRLQPESGAWLLPWAAEHDFAMTNVQFKDAWAGRFGLSCPISAPLVAAAVSCDCAKSVLLSPSGYHLSTCKRDDGNILRHDTVLHVIAAMCRDAGLLVRVEVLGIIPATSRRADLIVFGASRLPAVYDLSIGHPGAVPAPATTTTI
jgi:hypothetical protein